MSNPSASSDTERTEGQISRAGGLLQITIDAGAAASGMINFSLNVLGRLSQAGIDTLTFGITVLVGAYIPWSPVGFQRVYDAIEKIQARKGFKDILWFGFGQKSPIQVLVETDQGVRFTALSSCLTEVYSTHMAAQIMLAFSRKIVDKMPEPRPPLPSLLQMHLLVEKTAGILSATSFPLWAEEYMAFDGERFIGQHAWPRALNKVRYSRGVGSAIEIADALYSLMELSNGTLRNITLVGVADAGLVAAIGAWLLDLKIVMYASEKRDENIVFRNTIENVEPQLTIIFTRREDRTALCQRGKTVFLSDATVLFKSHAQLKPNQDRVVGGRVHWKEALSRTFGEDFKSLLAMPVLFGAAIGSAARIFTALVEADPDVDMISRRHCSSYFPDSFGQNLINFALDRFPELNSKLLRAETVNAARIPSYGQAQATFESTMNKLAASCGCKVCCPAIYSNKEKQARTSRDNTSVNHTTPRFCLVAISETVIILARRLSGIVALESLHPKRAGLEYIYEIQQTRVSRLRKQDGKNALPIMCSIVEHGTPDLAWTEVSLLRFAQHIFSGQTLHDETEDPGCSATAMEGVCCYLDILREPQQDDPISLCRVNVIPGYIQWNDRVFHKVGEKSTNLFSATVALKGRPQDCVPEKVVRDIERSYGGRLNLLVSEELSKDRRAFLEVDYGIFEETRELGRFGPAKAARSICRSSGLISCQNDGCVESTSIAHELKDAIADGNTGPVLKLDICGSKVTIFQDDQVVRLLAAFGCWEPLFQRGECLACCVRTGCRNGWKTFAVVQSGSTCRNRGKVYPRIPNDEVSELESTQCWGELCVE
ncbi:uncharacterized protein Z518_03642 [Rhinocladiella mackenziei CBS 650.93]|uniref:Uncharacterized protein n=1 Tax=Rhinocladiella mackenziei CBS 650.93 TaxID=1442369 RepID=A0A0D2J973_9EURO|nr:uncharacterized protein Z518_03642 [Rhinocladiella mackenziei CBS 650.93]KIX05670.1 hypothetical protein Z518_03642 [Rhinocladiella mackenziei CBS 650.93]